MTKTTVLTDAKVQNLPVPAKGKRKMVYDGLCPGLLVRCYDSGKRTWMLAAAFPPQTDITRRQLGQVGQMLVDDARAKARKWLAWIDQGLDPAVQEENERKANTVAQVHTVAVLCEDYIERKVKSQRRGPRTTREIRNEIIPVLGKTPVRDVTRQDIVKLCEGIIDRKRRVPQNAEFTGHYHAHTIFGHLRAIFNYALDRGTYGLERSPCDRMNPSSLLGAREPRNRLLDADEVRALWKATGKMGYAMGPLYRALLLSGCRLEEIAHAHRSEIKGNTLVIPSERFKSKSQHFVPITPALAAVFADCPVFKTGGFLFSATWGRSPVQNFGRQKARLDRLMRAELSDLPPWKNHDLRHFVRSTLSRLRIPDHIAELCIGHGRKGLARIYDHHKAEDEIREAMTEYSQEVLRLVGEPVRIREAAE